MAFVPVPKDLNAVKTKVMFNLTKRQLICFGCGALMGVPLFFLTKDSMGASAATIIMILAMLPFFLLAMYEKNGQPLEKVLENFIQVSFLRPKHRPYKTNNFYSAVDRQADLNKEVKAVANKKKLTKAERKYIEEAIRRAKNQDKNQKSAQESIPFQRMYPDGICRVTDHFYTKTVQFNDINYQLNQNEDKTAIFDGWCDFLNYFDSSVKFQLSFVNLAANTDTYAKRIAIPLQGDDYDALRSEYSQMLQNQLAKGNNGLIKTKYLTFGVEADNLKEAKPRLERIELDVLNNFRRLGVSAESMNGFDRLKLMHGMMHMDEPEPFCFDWSWLAPSGLSVKDFIAPSSFAFRNGKTFYMGQKVGAVSFLQILAPELNDRIVLMVEEKRKQSTQERKKN